MSHVAAQETKPGEPMFADMEALKLAAEMCGCEVVKQKTYHWYNRHMGDYPLPKGVKVDQLGKNAEYVVRVKAENYAKLGIGGTPYELGLINDPNNPGCLTPIYDFYQGGYGLEKAIGTPLFNDAAKQVVRMLAPQLKQKYDMACDALAAKASGDHIEFLSLKDAAVKYPAMFPKTDDEVTFVSVATGQRLTQLQE